VGKITETHVSVAIVTMVTVNVGPVTNIAVTFMNGRSKAKHLGPMVGWLLRWLVGWFEFNGLTALSTQFRSYRAFKVELYYKY